MLVMFDSSIKDLVILLRVSIGRHINIRCFKDFHRNGLILVFEMGSERESVICDQKQIDPGSIPTLICSIPQKLSFFMNK